MSAAHTGRPSPRCTRRTIQRDSAYRDAERAVAWLSDQGFAVERVAIVGTGLGCAECVPERASGVARLIGAGQGTMVGLFFALPFVVFSGGGLVPGAMIGVVLGLAFHYMLEGRRDFAYDVQVDERVAAEAERLIAAMPRTGS
jgi:predicted lysophospholipase L1 biosynthesis ABC-type transport system permease subunit